MKIQKRLGIIIVLAFVICSEISLVAQTNPRSLLFESFGEKNKRMEWWRNSRFGMFIHWGPYAVYAGEYKGHTVNGVSEWIMDTEKIPIEDYESVAATFNPIGFNAENWVKLALNAGMKYIIITAKHHDGFCMWDTKTTDFSITHFTNFKRDPISELSDACKKFGMGLGFYYSIMDWHHKDAKGQKFQTYRDSYMKPQLTELITRYDPSVLWFDGEWIDEWTEEQGKDLYCFVRTLKPELIVNNRVGKGRNGMQGMNTDREAVGDFGTPEQEIVGSQSAMDWEACMTMNDSWGFKRMDNNWKSVDQLLSNLIEIVSKGGNFLLNVGPDALGVIPEPSKKRLLEMGQWIEINRKGLYEIKTLNRYKDSKSVYLVQNQAEDTIYAFTLKFPSGRFNIKGVKPRDGSVVSILGNAQPLPWKFNMNSGLLIDIPERFDMSAHSPKTFVIHGSPVAVSDDPLFISSTGLVSTPFLFTRSAELSIKSPNSKAEIFYRIINEAVPDSLAEWRLYKRPLLLSNSATVTSRIREEGKVESNICSVECLKIQNISEIELFHQPDQQYYSSGELALVDKKRGSDDFMDGNWLGFHGVPFEAIIDLGIQNKISSISVGFLSDQNSWIFLPEEVIVETAAAKNEFKTIRTFDNFIQKNEIKKGIHNFKVDLPNYETRYIRITGKSSGLCPSWHPGANQKSWIFTDEIIIE